MTSIPLTLAALATSAVPGLTVFGVRELEPNTDYAEAVIVSEDAELLVRVPRTQAGETAQRAELLGLAALTEGPRSELPFLVPEPLGITRAGQTRAVVTSYLPGASFDVADLREDSLLLESLAASIAAIHSLPASVAQAGGLPVRTADDARLAATRIIDRAEKTRLVPETVARRWLSVVEASELWDFAPVVVHGTLTDEQVLVIDDRVSGVLGWSGFAVDDPALDFTWLLGAGSEVLTGVLERYADLHNPGVLDKLRSRVALYHELEVAKWLLHGVDTHDQEIIDDAVSMLDNLVAGGHTLNSIVAKARSGVPLTSDEAESILSETPEVVDYLSETAAYEALDEERMFSRERLDAAAPLRAVDVDAAVEAALAAADAAEAAAAAGVPAGADVAAASDEASNDGAGWQSADKPDAGQPDAQPTEDVLPDIDYSALTAARAAAKRTAEAEAAHAAEAADAGAAGAADAENATDVLATEQFDFGDWNPNDEGSKPSK